MGEMQKQIPPQGLIQVHKIELKIQAKGTTAQNQYESLMLSCFLYENDSCKVWDDMINDCAVETSLK